MDETHARHGRLSLRGDSVRRRRRAAVSGDVLLHGLPANERSWSRCYDGLHGGAIHVTPGAREFVSKADSGNDIVRAFCPTCGSGIYSRNAGMPHLIFLRASALDDPSLFAPQLAVWAARAPAWDAVPAHLPAFAEAPGGN